MKTPRPVKRVYRLGARGEAADANTSRMLEAFTRRLQAGWYDEITLDAVAHDAGVTVQTVIRRFGSKDGLLEAAIARMSVEIQSRRATPPGDLAAAIATNVDDYEVTGDLILRLLAQEGRFPSVRRMVESGRAEHRAWVDRVGAPWLRGVPAAEARQRRDGLLVATDLYTWKRLRRDLGRSVAATKTVMLRLARGVVSSQE
jgi:AcrR family transcriptional regulator